MTKNLKKSKDEAYPMHDRKYRQNLRKFIEEERADAQKVYTDAENGENVPDYDVGSASTFHMMSRMLEAALDEIDRLRNILG